MLGAGTRLARTDRGRIVPEDRDRALALLAVAAGRPVSAAALAPIDKAAEDWRRGNRALSNIRLALAGLPRLDHDDAAAELALGGRMLDAGVAPSALIDALAAYVPTFRADGLSKGYVNQLRVPAGNGRESGRWTAFWSAVRDWLNVEVPAYDLATLEQVGTQTRGAQLAPLAIVAAGTAVVLGGEAAIGAALSATAPTVNEGMALLPASLSRAKFGALAGFEQGLLASTQASIAASAETIEALQEAGVTRRMVSVIQRAYAQVARDTPQNVFAIHRAERLLAIKRGWK